MDFLVFAPHLRGASRSWETASLTPRFDEEELLAEIQTFYAAWDAAVDRDRGTMPPGFACPSDCARCCERSPAIPVTAGEALAAARALDRLPEALRERLAGRVRALAALVTPVETDSSGSAGPPGLDGPCPLLEGGRCSIYAARPLFCRAYGFAADSAGYFGCEVLQPGLAVLETVTLTSLDAGRRALPVGDVLDAGGKALPECGMLAELVARLLDSPVS